MRRGGAGRDEAGRARGRGAGAARGLTRLGKPCAAAAAILAVPLSGLLGYHVSRRPGLGAAQPSPAQRGGHRGRAGRGRAGERGRPGSA